MTRVLLAVGANLGERKVTLGRSLDALSRLPRTRMIARSTWHETAPVGGIGHQPSFLNGAVLLETAISPQELASQLRQIELHLGRERHARWDARKIDLDILLYGDQTIATPDLEVPHPRMAFRRFVLDPACEIAGELIHPTSGWMLAALRHHWQTLPHTVTVQSQDRQLADWLSRELLHHVETNQSVGQTIELVDSEPTMLIQLGSMTSHHGPVVKIASTDRPVILQEALAAVAAAWPE
jgi:2-amino-4-hydroxy-6-hydroxymethyldihydropteridine diphosphokinase